MNQNLYKQLLQHLDAGEKVVLKTEYKGRFGKGQENIRKLIIPQSQCEGLALDSLKMGSPLVTSQNVFSILTEPFFPDERLIVLGGGHIALPLVEFAAKIGFSVTLIDDRPNFANSLRFPQAKQVICGAFDRAIHQLKIRDSDYVVIITRGHRHDQNCLEQLLKGHEPFYIGMIGSRRRVGVVKELLREAGFSFERLERVHTPIGLEIGAVTPEEIAISIAAELIACKRKSNVVATKEVPYINRSEVDLDVLRTLAEEKDEPKSIVTVISSKGSVPRGAGAKMIVYPYGKIKGSIGGGCSEAAVIEKAREIIGTKSYQLETIDMSNVAESEGMVCGGVIEVLIEDYS